MGGALIFSTVNALQLWIQVLGLPVSSDFAVMLPYILTIVVLAVDGQAGSPACRAGQALRAGRERSRDACCMERARASYLRMSD